MEFTPQQRSLILEYIQECKSDGVPDKQLPYEVSGFIRSMGTQARDRNLQMMAEDKEAIAQLLSAQG